MKVETIAQDPSPSTPHPHPVHHLPPPPPGHLGAFCSHQAQWRGGGVLHKGHPRDVPPRLALNRRAHHAMTNHLLHRMPSTMDAAPTPPPPALRDAHSAPSCPTLASQGSSSSYMTTMEGPASNGKCQGPLHPTSPHHPPHPTHLPPPPRYHPSCLINPTYPPHPSLETSFSPSCTCPLALPPPLLTSIPH